MLARKRAMQKQQQKSSASVPTSGQTPSLLDALKKNSSAKKIGGANGSAAKQSLLERLQSLKLSSKGSVSGHTVNTNAANNTNSEVPHTATRTLASKLASLRKAKPEPKKDEELPVSQEPKKNGEPGKNQENVDTLKRIDNTWTWKIFKKLNDVASPNKTTNISKSPSLLVTNIIIQEERHENASLKRKHDELFTVYYPNTNNGSAKKQAISNFNKPSPDDVALTQQKAAFEVDRVKDNIAKLSLQEKKDTQSKHNNNNNDNVGEKEEDADDYEDDDEYDRVNVEDAPIRTYKKATVPTKPKNPIDIQSHLADKKPHLNFVVLGHVDAGKSTLMGRLLYDVGAVDSKLIRKLQKESEMAGKSSFHLAWVMDQTAEERNRGVTVDICTSDFATSKGTFTIVDAPGHRDFVPNAIVGISQADVAVLSVDCGTDAFESGFNLDGQTKEHALLARSLGIKHIIVAMNKMDTVGWYEGRFLDIKSELLVFFEEIGFESENISYVPCSGLTGEGIFKTPYPIGQTWYKGPNLVQELEITAAKYSKISGEEDIKEPFIFNILDVTPTSKNTSAVISGKVEAGSIQPGETITIFPSEQSCVVDSILCGNDNKKVDIALRGDFVQLKLHGAFAEDIQSGDLASVAGYDIPSAQEFTCRLLTFKIDRPLLPGTSLILFRGATEQPCRIKKLCYTVNKKNPTEVLKKKVRHLGSFQSAIVEIELVEKKRRIPMLTIKENKKLGRVVLRKEGKTIGAAVINSLDY